MARSEKTVYFHYTNEESSGNKQNLYQNSRGASGLTVSGSEYSSITETGTYSSDEHNTFNTETGLHEPNDKSESHIIINESAIEGEALGNLLLSGSDRSEEVERDLVSIDTEVHEATHVLESGYDATETIENPSGGYFDTGRLKLPPPSRDAEKAANANGQKARDELEQKK